MYGTLTQATIKIGNTNYLQRRHSYWLPYFAHKCSQMHGHMSDKSWSFHISAGITIIVGLCYFLTNDLAVWRDLTL